MGLDRPYWRNAYLSWAPGTDQAVLRPGVWPIESVTSVTTDDGTVVDSTTYSIRGAKIFRSYGWPRWRRRDALTLAPAMGEQDVEHYMTALTAGWLMPGQVSAWAALADLSGLVGASTSYGASRGGWCRPTDITIKARLELTTAGTTGATEPDWSSYAVGETITDGSAVWTVRDAVELPADLSEAAMLWILDVFKRRAPAEDLRFISDAGASKSFAVEQLRSGPPLGAAATIQGYR